MLCIVENPSDVLAIENSELLREIFCFDGQTFSNRWLRP